MYRWEDNIKIYDKDSDLQATNEHGSELLDSVKGREFFDQLRDLHLLKHAVTFFTHYYTNSLMRSE
jgi:hypothetical protein